MNKKYDLTQGINFIEIPVINQKRMSNIQKMIKELDEKSNNYTIEKLFENEVVTPNLLNIKNPSNDCVLYFSSRKDVSRVNYDFKVFPKQEINYYFHENKYLYCYVTQLNNSISIDINWLYSKDIKNNNGIDKNQIKYECLKIFSGEVIASGDTSWSDYIDKIDWSRYMNLIINTNKNYDLYVKRKNGLDIIAYENTLVSGAGATSANLCLFYIPSNTSSIASLGHSLSFGVKNNDVADDMTVSMYGEFFE